MAQPQNRTAPVEQEPEFVGVHSGLVNDICQIWDGDSPEDIEQCGDPATHTAIEYTGRLHQLAVCDDHGNPDALPESDREWTGESPQPVSRQHSTHRGVDR
ncbi:hypothetical protein [Natronosalvus amylolyticus]|uniref:hypothetical protein n=1 Tax=Natronosalvus amylolyticus TaxID=2961994 RepID=UPI0020CA1A4C|nr:hypothetical protein [Natronosalvus amylolyticus]